MWKVYKVFPSKWTIWYRTAVYTVVEDYLHPCWHTKRLKWNAPIFVLPLGTHRQHRLDSVRGSQVLEISVTCLRVWYGIRTVPVKIMASSPAWQHKMDCGILHRKRVSGGRMVPVASLTSDPTNSLNWASALDAPAECIENSSNAVTAQPSRLNAERNEARRPTACAWTCSWIYRQYSVWSILKTILQYIR